jgi:carboxylesterase type B
MPDSPALALKDGKFNRNLDLMFGTVSVEGALFVESLFPLQLDPDLPPENVTITVDQAKVLIGFMFQLFKENYGQEVADFYTKDLKESDKDGIRKAVGDAFGDYHITCPTVLFGEMYGHITKADRVFAYRVVQPPSIPVFLNCHGWMGVCHGDDVLYLFSFPIRLRGIVFTEADYKLAVDMIKAWTTFAHTGTPTPTMSNGAKWLEAVDHSKAESTVSYMSLNATGYALVDNYYAKTCDQFWKPKILV